MIQVENYVGGKFITLDENFDDISPLDFSVIAQIPRTKNIDDAVSAARGALPAWSNYPLKIDATGLTRLLMLWKLRLKKWPD